MFFAKMRILDEIAVSEYVFQSESKTVKTHFKRIYRREVNDCCLKMKPM